MLLETSIYAQINLLCLHAVNGTLRCAPHGKRESESGRNAERASSSQQHEREGATRVEPHAGASGSHLRRWLLLGKVVPGSATRQSNHQRSILKEMTLPAFESTHGAREPVSMKGGCRAGQLLSNRFVATQRAWAVQAALERLTCLSSVLVRPVEVQSMRRPGNSEYHAMPGRKEPQQKLATMPCDDYEMKGHLRKLAVPPDDLQPWHAEEHFLARLLRVGALSGPLYRCVGALSIFSQKNILRQMLTTSIGVWSV